MRPTWDQYFMGFAELASTRCTCIRRTVGAVIVKDHQIIATGYNGVPRGMNHCEKVGCIRNKLNVPSGERHEICRGLHAEQNTIIQAARHGACIKDSEIYITFSPCMICAKMIINAGIKRIIYAGDYTDELAMKFLEEVSAEIIIEQYKG